MRSSRKGIARAVGGAIRSTFGFTKKRSHAHQSPRERERESQKALGCLGASGLAAELLLSIDLTGHAVRCILVTFSPGASPLSFRDTRGRARELF